MSLLEFDIRVDDTLDNGTHVFPFEQFKNYAGLETSILHALQESHASKMRPLTNPNVTVFYLAMKAHIQQAHQLHLGHTYLDNSRFTSPTFNIGKQWKNPSQDRMNPYFRYGIMTSVKIVTTSQSRK